ncbi:hypothetical protein INS04_10200 [Enterobacter asburiae]|uniref:hypothetical protein n=1 Tax=Enterobacter asburiae TaxID=61645 RepID=UPI00187EEBAD|nr:hypothetical protein [Enterobacter asburiae]QOV80874.1 hypothetical protein INS04_10200 [Enterobacter asburiae]
MKNGGNLFEYWETSTESVAAWNQKKAEVDEKKLSNKKKGINKRILYPSYEIACVPYVPQKDMISPENRLIAETSLLATPGALECGYSQCIDWTADGILDERVYKSIGMYACARLRLAGSCVEISPGKAFKMRKFYKCIETSEKSTLSFILGGFFCFQSANYWLRSRHEQIEHFIHAGLIKKASLQFYPDKDRRKTPDYLIQTHAGEWHVFESKGGEHTPRWQRIEEAVAQLDSVTHVVCKNGPPEQIRTFVCTHTSIDADKDIVINVVDPLPDLVQPIIINPDVCILLSKLTSISLFDTLSAIKSSQIQKIPGMDDWIFVGAPEYDDVHFGIPEVFQSLKNKLKLRLGIYLLIKEVIDLNLTQNKESVNGQEVNEKLSALLPSSLKQRRVIDAISPFIPRKITHSNYGDYFNLLSENLGLPKLTKKMLEEEKRLVNDLPETIKKHRSPWGGLTRKAPLPGFDDPWTLAQRNKRKKPRMKR